MAIANDAGEIIPKEPSNYLYYLHNGTKKYDKSTLIPFESNLIPCVSHLRGECKNGPDCCWVRTLCSVLICLFDFNILFCFCFLILFKHHTKRTTKNIEAVKRLCLFYTTLMPGKKSFPCRYKKHCRDIQLIPCVNNNDEVVLKKPNVLLKKLHDGA